MTLAYAIAQKGRMGGGGPRAMGDTIPAPVKGWNARDPLANMNPEFATILDNYFPGTGYVELRRGSATHATGIGTGAVETLFSYRSGSASKLLAFGNDEIHDATASAAVGTALATDLTSDRWQCVNFNGKGILVNGQDAPRSYDGSAITVANFSGPDNVNDLFYVHPFKSRLLFLEKDSASFWYGGIKHITGVLTEFPLGSVHPGGGRALALGTLTIDGGDGIDDLLAIFMDSGDVLIYAGTDPSSATTFGLIGIFHIGRVIGSRPLVKVGPDLIAITADGYLPLGQFLRLGRARRDLAVSDNIVGAANEAVRNFGDHFGWQAILYPKANWLLINVPEIENRHVVQHVMNTRTGAWCRFTGMRASCWAVHEEKLYFGGPDGEVFLADTLGSDDGGSIFGDLQSAYSYFRGKARLKRFTMYRPTLSVDASLNVAMGLGIDFEAAANINTSASISSVGTVWDTALWGAFAWSGGQIVNKSWQSTGKIGTSAAVRIKTATDAHNIRIYSTDVLYERGAYV